jgi:flagellar biosynthesis protein FlhF
MSLETFHGESIKEALEKVRIKYGADAAIMGTRTIERRGSLGLTRRSIVEITAGPPSQPKVETARNPASPAPRRADARLAAYESVAEPRDETLGTTDVPASEGFDLRLFEELKTIKELVAGAIDGRAVQAVEESPENANPDLPQVLLDAYSRLIGKSVASQWAEEIFGNAAANMGDEADPARIRAYLAKELERMLPTTPGIHINPARRGRIIAFVGATGVGKTTTVAKVASIAKMKRQVKVSVATTDNTKPGSVEPLRSYASMMDAPFEAVEGIDGLKEMRKKHMDSNIILLDTQGVSPFDDAGITELADQLSAVEPDETHLVLSATTQPAAAREAIYRFHALGADRVVVTKVDEAVGLGILIALAEQFEARLSYLTAGRNVPDDIEIASAGRLARMILSDTQARGSG